MLWLRGGPRVGGWGHWCDGHGGWPLLDKIWDGQMSVVGGEGRTFFPIIDFRPDWVVGGQELLFDA